MFVTENWVVCARYPSYEVSTYGRVRNKRTGHVKAIKKTTRYPQVTLYDHALPGYVYVQLARLIAEAFHGPLDEKRIVYRDEDPFNCRSGNLYLEPFKYSRKTDNRERCPCCHRLLDPRLGKKRDD